MGKIDFLHMAAPIIEPVDVEITADGVTLTLKLRPLNAIEELDIAASIAESMKAHPDGLMLGSQVITPTERTWQWAFMLHTMQVDKVYSPEEFLALFAKCRQLGRELVRKASEVNEGKASAPSGSPSQGSASSEAASIPSSPSV